MKSKRLLILLLMALLVPWAAQAQKALPYSYGFEDNDLSADGWTTQNPSGLDATEFGIYTGAAKTGTYGFRFSSYDDQGAHTQYLISPELNATTGVVVQFYYKASSTYGTETFKVGYSTTNTEISSFTFGDEISTSSTTWAQSEEFTFPAGTKYVAIYYYASWQYRLYVDDFSFTVPPTCPKPTIRAVNTTNETATVTWTPSDSNQTLFDLYWSTTNTAPTDETTPLAANQSGTSYTITGLTAATTYYVWLRGNCGTAANPDISGGWTSVVSFRTECDAYPIPFSMGFETEELSDLTSCWRLMGSFYTTTNTDYVHTGDRALYFYYTQNPPQYLISPRLSGIVNGLHVEFWYRQYTSGSETFQVGYSTTDKNTSSFTWGDVITATTSYQRFSANYPAETKYVAIKHLSNYEYYLYIDDILFEESASCLEPTNVVASGITTTGANIRWNAGATETAWDLYVTTTDTIIPNDATTPTVANTSDNPYPLENLTPATTYYVYVRAACSATETSAWSSPGIFNTKCEGIDLPFAYGFEDEALSVCWNVINTNTSYNFANIDTDEDEAYEGEGYLSLYRGSSEGFQIVVLPEVDGAYALNEYEVSFYAKLYDDYGYNSYGYGRTLAVGVMTDPSDASTFVQVGDAITPTTEYQPYTVQLFSYTGSGKYLAIKHNSTVYGYTFIDNLEVNLLPTCLPPTELAARNITTNSANLSWQANTNETEWTLYWKKASAETYTKVTGVTDNPYPLDNLTAGTNYDFYVVANCAADDESDPSAVYTFATECDVLTPISSSPYVENFDSYDVPDYYYNYSLYYADRFMPNCWSVIDTTHYAENSIIYPTMWNYSQYDYFNSSPNCFRFYLDGSKNQQGQFAILPQMNDVNTLRIRLNATSSYYSGNFIFGVMTDPTDARTFVQVGDTIKPTSSYANYTLNFNSYEGTGQYIAIKLFPEGTGTKYLYIDDVVVDPIPSCLEPANIEATATGYIATITWESDAESFDVAYATSATANPDENIAQTGIDTTAYISGALALGDYYFWVRANCEKDGYSPWVGPESVHIGYCVPAPTSVDGNGISNVSFGTGENIVDNNTHPSAAPYYGDYSAQIGAVQAGVQATVDITYNTCGYSDCYNYGTVIWIDLNNNLSFEDNEIVFAGQSSPDSYPSGAHTLNATFTIPATQATGDYRMRIGGADSYFDYFISGTATAAHDPCYSGSYTIFEDYTLRVLEAPDCLPAGDVTVAPASIGTTTAVISWTNNNGDEATYTVMQGETVLTTTAVDSYELTGLTAATTYPAGTFTIISDCDENAIANVPAFTTACETIVVDVDHPYTEDFEGTVFPPTCWEAPTTQYYNYWGDEYTTSWTASSYYNHTENGTGSAYSYYYGGDDGLYLVMPDIQLSSEGGSAQLTFWSYNDYASSYEKNSVVLLDGEDEIELWSPESVTSSWKADTIDLTAYMGQTITLAFKYEGDDAHAWYVDDVEVSVAPFTQTLELVEGWNWISVYVEADDLMEQLQTGLGENGLEIWYSDGSMEYDEEYGWDGDEFEITNETMYLVKTSAACTVELSGEPADPAGYAIDINPGWNWIGYPNTEEMTFEEALSSFEPEEGDQIWFSEGSSEYDEYGWDGDLDSFVPGEGYMYYSVSSETKPLVFASGDARARVLRRLPYKTKKETEE